MIYDNKNIGVGTSPYTHIVIALYFAVLVSKYYYIYCT